MILKRCLHSGALADGCLTSVFQLIKCQVDILPIAHYLARGNPGFLPLQQQLLELRVLGACV